MAELLACALALGIGATLVVGLWAIFQRHVLGIPSLDYAMVGRWLGHLPRGRLAHHSIALAVPIPGERAIGWIAHYAIGVVFALLLLAIWGLGWALRPTRPSPSVSMYRPGSGRRSQLSDGGALYSPKLKILVKAS